MRIYHDWEFLEDSFTIKPISVGMVREDGKELYFEFMNAPWTEVYRHEWLKNNVVPGLTCPTDGSLVTMTSTDTFKPKPGIMSKVFEFLLDAYKADYKNGIQLWGWYSSYDHVCLAQLFGRMIDLPDFIPMWTNDVRQEFARLGDPNYPRQTEGLHNALEDAKFLKTRHEWLMKYESGLKNVTISGGRNIQLGNGNTQHNVY